MHLDPLCIVCLILAFAGFGLQVAGIIVATSAQPPEQAPAQDQSLHSPFEKDAVYAAISRRTRQFIAAQKCYAAGACALFLSTVCALAPCLFQVRCL